MPWPVRRCARAGIVGLLVGILWSVPPQGVALAERGDVAAQTVRLHASSQPILSAGARRHLKALQNALATRDLTIVSLRPDLSAPSLRIEITPTEHITARRIPIDVSTTRSAAWYGEVDEGGYVLFVEHAEWLHGIVLARGRTYAVSPLDTQWSAVQRVAAHETESACAGEPHGATRATHAQAIAPSPRRISAGLAPGESQPRVTTPSVIVDVLVAYEPGVRDLVPSVTAHIEFLTAWANLAYTNSRIHTAAGPCWEGENCVSPKLRVVAITEIDCRGCDNPDLTNLTLNTRFALPDDGWFDEVHALRDDMGADVCVLLTAVDRVSGSGSAKLGSPHPDWAFCLAETPYSLGHPYIFAHEVGHLQGAGHFSQGGDRPYARGYCHNPPGGDPAERFSTIMCTQSSSRIPYWSNPELEYEPTPGHVFPIGDDDHNNARRLNETALEVASHRGQNVTPVEVADFVARASGDGVRLTWQLAEDAPQVLAGVHVQRAFDRAGPYDTRTRTMLVPEQRMTWTDAELAFAASWWYRLMLMSSNGEAAFVGPVRADGAAQSHVLHAPFRSGGELVVRYDVGPSATRVRLNVHDVRGRLVRVLEQRSRPPGTFEVRWDRRDDGGRVLPGGVYFIELTTDDNASIRKVLVLRE